MTLLLAESEIPQAARLLQEGQLVAFGTETVYGLGADAANDAAVAAIYTAKGRPGFNPLICHFPTAEAAFAHVHTDATAESLAEKFWPGPLTLILPRRESSPITPRAAANLPTIAIRVPAPAAARALLAAAARPIAAPSANQSGKLSPTTAAHVLASLGGRIVAVLDIGPCQIGLESTVLDLSTSTPHLLRPGAIPRETLESLLGPLPTGSETIKSPGQTLAHYAPTLPLRLNATRVESHEALLAFGPPLPAPLTYNLSPTGNLAEAAANLFAGLHWLDTNAPAQKLTSIAAMPIPTQGIGQAIEDRLKRAGRIFFF